MFTSILLRIILKNGLICGLLIVLFAVLKSELFYGKYSHDLYITLIATSFIIAGFYFGSIRFKFIKQNESKNETETKALDLMVSLSKRELKVFDLLLSDLSNKEIANSLCVELSTLKSHINSVYRKLEVKNRRELLLKFKAELNLVVS